MKKIGFVDYYLDEWHANNYPRMIEEACGEEFKVAYAYGKQDMPGKMPNREWADTYGVTLLDSIEEVVEKSDCIVVLSPDNPEMHEELSVYALKSGKPLYIDKAFAPTLSVAKRMFAYADRYETPCYSASALYFSAELSAAAKEDTEYVASLGPGAFAPYSIHQIEPIVVLMGGNCADRVMYTGTEHFPSLKLAFSDGRHADIVHMPGSFRSHIGYKNGKTADITVSSPYFSLFIEGMLEFFRTGEIPVPHAQTLAVIAIREAALKAMEAPFTWIYTEA